MSEPAAPVADPPKRRGRPKKLRVPTGVQVAPAVSDAWRDKVLDLNALPQSVGKDGLPLALPTPADPACAYYAVRLQTADHLADQGKVQGFQAVRLIEGLEVELCDPTPSRSRVYPVVPAGHRPDADQFERPQRNHIVNAQCPDGQLHPMYYMDAAAFGFPVTLPVQVKRRAWQHIEEDDRRYFEDPQAAAATSERPVVQVTLWCPVMDVDPQNPASQRPHGDYLGSGEWNPYTQRKGNGYCARCNTNEKRQFQAADIGRRLKRR